MDKLVVPASITMEKGISIKKYRWKSDDKKESTYKRPNRRAVIRFSSKNFANKMNKMKRGKRQISVEFLDKSNIRIRRMNSGGTTLQAYSGPHPYIQIVVNKVLPNELWKVFEESKKKQLLFL